MVMRRIVLGVVALVVVLGGWYAFRPERLFIDTTVNESFDAAPAAENAPAAAPRVLLAGEFHSNAHETSGAATIYQLATGQRTLRLTNFATSNGPDVRVYLVAATDVNDDATVKRAGFIELGALKGNQGDQNYDVPADVDLATYRSVTIWCRRFSVNFGTAPLQVSAGTD